jgi:hypothetical protein
MGTQVSLRMETKLEMKCGTNEEGMEIKWFYTIN